MSLTVAVVLNAALALGLVALLAYVMRIPYRLDRVPAPAPADRRETYEDERLAA